MEYCDQYNGVAGSIPEFGAIVMSNLLMKKECFKRKLFSLPHAKAEFVKHVKAGMVLFLFDSVNRQLFGVFRASSDGAMDIVPHAFKYSGKHFPAQVWQVPALMFFLCYNSKGSFFEVGNLSLR
ncbi:DCD (Development and Cell Death) domain protein [Striga asiatica]|uniref:DCD (Development and Cell Death) domain protein n=1 Tax=Striga asiatica TaxID=4170 RepID=A0A5A7PKK7_STRAF|nr:DCD (Development and Cell Death) domain protein [Striga asiatica]